MHVDPTTVSDMCMARPRSGACSNTTTEWSTWEGLREERRRPGRRRLFDLPHPGGDGIVSSSRAQRAPEYLLRLPVEPSYSTLAHGRAFPLNRRGLPLNKRGLPFNKRGLPFNGRAFPLNFHAVLAHGRALPLNLHAVFAHGRGFSLDGKGPSLRLLMSRSRSAHS